MSLRRKLLTLFAGLGFLVLTVVGITFWALVQWRTTNVLLQEHYQRSLYVQRISSSTFRAFKELPDAAFTGDADARTEFRALLGPVERDFRAWAELAHTEGEREQVARVRGRYDALVGDAETFFGTLAAGRRAAALALLETRIENVAFEAFGEAVDAAVASDRSNRGRVRDRNERVRRSAWTVLTVAAFATVSLVLLLAAYLSSDLFRPLRGLREALEGLSRGDLGRRLDAERRDEFGAVNRAFNAAAVAVGARERTLGQGPGAEPAAPAAATSRRVLHGLVGQLRAQVAGLGAGAATPEQRSLLATIDQLSHTVVRLSEFSFPLDLTLAKSDLRALLYEVLVRFHERFAERAVNLELRFAPELGEVVIDRLKLREVLSELLENALAALPERGGSIGLRTALGEDGTEFLLEVADDGRGVDAALAQRALSFGEPGAGLKLSKAVVEQHGGRFVLESEPNQGTYVQLRLPLYQG